MAPQSLEQGIPLAQPGERDVLGASPFPKRLVRDISPRTAPGMAGCSQALSLELLLAALMG